MSTTSHDLAREWLEYFGVPLAQELDLGTLCAIKKWIDEGRAPPPHTNSPDNPATAPRIKEKHHEQRHRHVFAGA